MMSDEIDIEKEARALKDEGARLQKLAADLATKAAENGELPSTKEVVAIIESLACHVSSLAALQRALLALLPELL
jgi:hypothetical protein